MIEPPKFRSDLFLRHELSCASQRVADNVASSAEAARNLDHEYLISPEYQRLRALHPRMEVETRLEPELLNIIGSPIHLAKSLMNLVSNAAEAMTSGDDSTERV